MQIEQLRNVAEPVAVRIAQLLETRVSILDQYGLELAVADGGSHPSGGQSRREQTAPYVVVQLPLGNEIVKVFVGEPHHSQPVSKSVAQRLIAMVVHQYTGAAVPADGRESTSGLVSALISDGAADDKALLREARQNKIDLGTRRCLLLVNTNHFPVSLAHADGRQPDGHSRNGDGHSDGHSDGRFDGHSDGRSDGHSDGHALRGKNWPSELILEILTEYFGKEPDSLYGQVGPGLYVVLKTVHADHLVKWVKNGDLHRYGENWVMLQVAKSLGRTLLSHLESDLGIHAHVSTGRYYPGVGGVALSYRDAQTAMRVGMGLLSRYSGRVFSLDELGFDTLAWIPQTDLKIEFARRLLSPLDPDPELLKTLEVFFEENCGAATTSQRLNLHRNSLYYRLDKIAGLVGLDPRKIDHAAIMRLSMRLREPHLSHQEIALPALIQM